MLYALLMHHVRDRSDIRDRHICAKRRRKALRVIPRGKHRLTVYRAHQVVSDGIKMSRIKILKARGPGKFCSSRSTETKVGENVALSRGCCARSTISLLSGQPARRFAYFLDSRLDDFPTFWTAGSTFSLLSVTQLIPLRMVINFSSVSVQCSCLHCVSRLRNITQCQHGGHGAGDTLPLRGDAIASLV